MGPAQHDPKGEDTSPPSPHLDAAEDDGSSAVRALLSVLHAAAAVEPIGHADDSGAFPAHWPAGQFAGGVPPVVADANVLRRDISYACRRHRRTKLVTAANADCIRLFCATHVIDEVFEHARGWAVEQAIDPAHFLACWKEEYIPLIREVRPGDIDEWWLTSLERSRLADLEDIDDRPSVALAIQLGALFLSTDRRALHAVYGPDVDVTAHDAWLDVLGLGGDAGQLGKVAVGSLAMARLAGHALLGVGRLAVGAASPVALAAVVAGAALVAGRRLPYDRWRHGLRRASTVLTTLAEIVHESQMSARAFGAMSVPPPCWSDLHMDVAPLGVRSRACLFQLARHPAVHASAAELAPLLPPINVAHGESLVRDTLRRGCVFHEVARGVWQVGRPVDSLSTHDTKDA